jgi:hypothetical protein
VYTRTKAFVRRFAFDRRITVANDKPVSHPDPYTRSANGKTASSYTTDGRWNIGGWSTYPSADELAISPGRRPPVDDRDESRR